MLNDNQMFIYKIYVVTSPDRKPGLKIGLRILVTGSQTPSKDTTRECIT